MAKKIKELERLSDEAYAKKKLYNARYVRENTMSIRIDFPYTTCGDIVEHLNNLKVSKSSYIKELIRKDINNG